MRRAIALFGLGARRLGALPLLVADESLALGAIVAGQLLTGRVGRLRVVGGDCGHGDPGGQRSDHAQAQGEVSKAHDFPTACSRGSSPLCQGCRRRPAGGLAPFADIPFRHRLLSKQALPLARVIVYNSPVCFVPGCLRGAARTRTMFRRSERLADELGRAGRVRHPGAR